MQIYQTQTHNTLCPPSTPYDVSQELIPQAAPLPTEKQNIRTLALDTGNDFCNYFEQASMIRPGIITQVSVRVAPNLYNMRHFQK
jgi:hypothetical protein